MVYTSRKNDLMLFAIPEVKCNLFELSLINSEIIKVIEFCYGTLEKCFRNTSNVKKLDHLFSRLFTQIMTCGYGWDSQKSVRIEDILLLSEIPSEPLFEQCLPIIQTVHLPWEAQLQIDDALTELDATYISRSVYIYLFYYFSYNHSSMFNFFLLQFRIRMLIHKIYSIFWVPVYIFRAIYWFLILFKKIF